MCATDTIWPPSPLRRESGLGLTDRSYELSKVSREALEPVILTSFFPRSVIDVFVEVLQADAGTRTAGINAAAVALADAGIPMKSMISSCAAGKVADTIVLDPMKEEDNFGQADLPIAMTPNGNITLMQMDGGSEPGGVSRGSGDGHEGGKRDL